MYAGQLMEQRSAHDLFATPMHPYTEALMASMPERSKGSSRLTTIPGMVPGLYDRPAGCLFGPRCNYHRAECEQRPTLRQTPQGAVRCHFPLGSAAAKGLIAEGTV
jgi:dipeptide transport system ATP-binding protein